MPIRIRELAVKTTDLLRISDINLLDKHELEVVRSLSDCIGAEVRAALPEASETKYICLDNANMEVTPEIAAGILKRVDSVLRDTVLTPRLDIFTVELKNFLRSISNTPDLSIELNLGTIEYLNKIYAAAPRN